MHKAVFQRSVNATMERNVTEPNAEPPQTMSEERRRNGKQTNKPLTHSLLCIMGFEMGVPYFETREEDSLAYNFSRTFCTASMIYYECSLN